MKIYQGAALVVWVFLLCGAVNAAGQGNAAQRCEQGSIPRCIIEHYNDGSRVEIYTDSVYVVNTVGAPAPQAFLPQGPQPKPPFHRNIAPALSLFHRQHALSFSPIRPAAPAPRLKTRAPAAPGIRLLPVLFRTPPPNSRPPATPAVPV